MNKKPDSCFKKKWSGWLNINVFSSNHQVFAYAPSNVN